MRMYHIDDMRTLRVDLEHKDDGVFAYVQAFGDGASRRWGRWVSNSCHVQQFFPQSAIFTVIRFYTVRNSFHIQEFFPQSAILFSFSNCYVTCMVTHVLLCVCTAIRYVHYVVPKPLVLHTVSHMWYAFCLVHHVPWLRIWICPYIVTADMDKTIHSIMLWPRNVEQIVVCNQSDTAFIMNMKGQVRSCGRG